VAGGSVVVVVAIVVGVVGAGLGDSWEKAIGAPPVSVRSGVIFVACAIMAPTTRKPLVSAAAAV
jgi:hypothetical protein